MAIPYCLIGRGVNQVTENEEQVVDVVPIGAGGQRSSSVTAAETMFKRVRAGRRGGSCC
jgi:hypothetical protein